MKKYITLCDITIENQEKLKIRIVPKGTVLKEVYDGGIYESKNPLMCVGVNWVENNPHVYKRIK